VPELPGVSARGSDVSLPVRRFRGLFRGRRRRESVIDADLLEEASEGRG